MDWKFDDERETRFDQREADRDVEKLEEEYIEETEDRNRADRGRVSDTRVDDREAVAGMSRSDVRDTGRDRSELRDADDDGEIGGDSVEIEEEVIVAEDGDSRRWRDRPADLTAPAVEANAGITLNGRYMPPPEDKDGKRWVRHTALVQAEPQELYELWRDIEQAPKWQEQILSVTRIGPNRFHWVMESNGKQIEWDAEILKEEPGKRIAWRSVEGDSRNAGEVVFEKAYNERGTMVTVLQEFEMSGLASFWETIVGRNPKQAVIENLRHFKAFVETGEIPRTHGQPHGPRGTTGSMKEAMYAEKEPPPPGHLKKAS